MSLGHRSGQPMNRRLRIGIAAMHFGTPGYSGGLDVYARQLVEALADYDADSDYHVFVYQYGLAGWNRRPWPPNVKRWC
jgi:hypothetical protein